jgi:hypothetical protein
MSWRRFGNRDRGRYAYTLVQPRDWTSVASEEFLPPSDDPAELISPWNPQADALSKLANVQPEALYQRTAELMVELGGPNFDGEELELRRRHNRLVSTTR